jgi:hypothetical protein
MVGLQPLARREIQMSALLTATDHTDHTDHTDAAAERRRARLWTVIEALAYAGAYIDPSGVLAVQRLRQEKQEEERRAQQ